MALVGCVALAALGVGAVATYEGDSGFPDRPPDGWYLVMEGVWPPAGASALPDERAWAENMVKKARAFGFPDARLWPEPTHPDGCMQPNPTGDGSWESNCTRAMSPRGYTVILEGPYSQPAEASPDPRHEWRRRMWQEKLAPLEAQGAPFGALPSLYLFSKTPRRGPAGIWDLLRAPVDDEARVIDGRQLPDGWYTTFFPGAFTTDDKRALYAARAMAWQVRQAGYVDITIVRWPTGPKTCRIWGCDGPVTLTTGRPRLAYVLIVRAHAAPVDTGHEQAWRAAVQAQEQQEAQHRGLVPTPFVVRLELSEQARSS